MKLQTVLILFAAVGIVGILISSVWVGRAETSVRLSEEPNESEKPPEIATVFPPVALNAGSDPLPQAPWTSPGSERATFGTGCFWCTEAIFEELEGVLSVVSGYSGGKVENPTHEEVCKGTTGHAEVVQITYDPKKISYKTLLRAFWVVHDPTSVNKQGQDEGPQYRSAIFFHNDEQQRLAEAFKTQLTKANTFGSPIVTEITRFESFFEAADFHQNYFAKNRNQPYCKNNIGPKIERFRKTFANNLKQ